MITRPPRRIPENVSPQHAWQNQAPQYDRADVVPVPNTIVQWTVPPGEEAVPIECLLAYDGFLNLVGILNYYPEGAPLGEKPHDFFFMVNPTRRRQGIGASLIREALRRWPDIDLLNQAYTDAGWETARSVLEET